jgi:hypothetical protein
MKRLEPGQTSRAMKEGREARKEGKARKSPYEGIALLQAFHGPWLAGWDAMDSVLSEAGAK